MNAAIQLNNIAIAMFHNGSDGLSALSNLRKAIALLKQELKQHSLTLDHPNARKEPSSLLFPQGHQTGSPLWFEAINQEAFFTREFSCFPYLASFASGGAGLAGIQDEETKQLVCLVVVLFNYALYLHLRFIQTGGTDQDLAKAARLYTAVREIVEGRIFAMPQAVHNDTRSSLAFLLLAVCTNMTNVCLELADLQGFTLWQDRVQLIDRSLRDCSGIASRVKDP